MDENASGGDGYWYADAEEIRASSVMEALRAYRAAEVAMRRRTRHSMDMGENELLVLRYLMRAHRNDEPVTPANLARYLGITSASTTALLDRLERTGNVTRAPNPGDRRSVVIEASDKADADIRRTLSGMHERMMDVVRPMSDGDRAVVIRFLEAMREAVDEIDE